jgi:hypothetical protein
MHRPTGLRAKQGFPYLNFKLSWFTWVATRHTDWKRVDSLVSIAILGEGNDLIIFSYFHAIIFQFSMYVERWNFIANLGVHRQIRPQNVFHIFEGWGRKTTKFDLVTTPFAPEL